MLFEALLKEQLHQKTLQLYRGATEASLTSVAGTYTGTAPLALGHQENEEEEE